MKILVDQNFRSKSFFHVPKGYLGYIDANTNIQDISRVVGGQILHHVGKKIFFVLQNTIYMFYNNLRKQNIQQLSTKNKKLLGFSKNVPTSSTEDSYNIPIINLSTYDIDTDPLKFGLHHSFIDKNKYIRRNLAVEMESLAEKLDKHVT